MDTLDVLMGVEVVCAWVSAVRKGHQNLCLEAQKMHTFLSTHREVQFHRSFPKNIGENLVSFEVLGKHLMGMITARCHLKKKHWKVFLLGS